MRDLMKVSDVIDHLFEANQMKVHQALERPQLIGWFVGQSMKRLNGEADPSLLNTMIRARLDFLKSIKP